MFNKSSLRAFVLGIAMVILALVSPIQCGAYQAYCIGYEEDEVPAGFMWSLPVRGHAGWEKHADMVPLSFAPKGDAIALSSEKGLAIHDLRSGASRKQLWFDYGRICYVDDGHVAVITKRAPFESLDFWDIESVEIEHRIEHEFNAAWSMQRSPDGSRLCVCGGNLSLWETKSRKLILEASLPLEEHSRPHGFFVDFARDAPVMATINSGKLVTQYMLNVYDIRDGKHILTHAFGRRIVHQVAISPNGRYAVTSEHKRDQDEADDGPQWSISLFDIQEAKKPAIPLFASRQMFFVNDDRLFIVDGYRDQTDGRAKRTVSLLSVPDFELEGTFEVADEPITFIAHLPKAELVAVSSENAVQLFDLKTMQLVPNSRRQHRGAFFLKPSPDERFLASVGDGVALYMWDMEQLAKDRK